MAGVIKLRRNTVEQQCFFSRSKEVKLERNFFPNLNKLSSPIDFVLKIGPIFLTER